MIAILDYGAGNLTSVRLAFERLGADAIVAPDADAARHADRIVFPGVGSAGSGMAGLRERGFDDLLVRAVAENRPVLAICLGMQMIFERSAEDGDTPGLAILPGEVLPFQFPAAARVKIPHMGWNRVSFTRPHPILQPIADGEAFYFVHSYYANPERSEDALGVTEYAGFTFTAIAARGSLFATQFHPERSGAAGLAVLKNFLTWDGRACS